MNDTILVTGASGFLGRHVVQTLRSDFPTRPIRALVRGRSLHLETLGVELYSGNVCDEQACVDALKGVNEVYHIAGLVSHHLSEASKMYQVHVEGTRTLLHAAADAHVKRVVVVSTSGTTGVSQKPDHLATESDPYAYNMVARWPYYLSKIYQEQITLELAKRLDLDVVIVCPTLLLGPEDTRASSTGEVELIVRGRLPVIPNGGGTISFVDARDAARGCILAMQKGKTCERYFLTGANMPLDNYLGRMARLAGVPQPRAVLPARWAKGLGRLLQGVFEQFDGQSPIAPQSLEMAQCHWQVNSSKAQSTLGWCTRDVQDTLCDTVKDVRQRCGMIERNA